MFFLLGDKSKSLHLTDLQKAEENTAKDALIIHLLKQDGALLSIEGSFKRLFFIPMVFYLGTISAWMVNMNFILFLESY